MIRKKPKPIRIGDNLVNKDDRSRALGRSANPLAAFSRLTGDGSAYLGKSSGYRFTESALTFS